MDLIARMGGDEFVLLLPGIQSSDDLLRIVDKINTAQERPCQLSPDIEITISAAAGTAVYPDDGMLADELLNTADEHMYRNKRNNERLRQTPRVT